MGLLFYNNKIMSKSNTLDENLISYWSFDTNANDIHRKYNGSINGATLNSNGKINSCYYFDGVGDWIVLPSELKPTGIFSINCWAKVDTWTDTRKYRGIFGGLGQGTVATKGGVCLLHARNPNINQNSIFLDVYSSTNRYSCVSNIPSEGEWHMYTSMYDGQYIKLYIDNILESEVNVGSITIDWTGSALFRIGYNYQNISSPNVWLGYIDEFGLWDKALSDIEINYLYNSNLALKYNNYRYGNI